MDGALLLALPLVGGLIFCNAWNVTRFRAAREEGYRLYFRVIFYGTFLFVVSLLIRVTALADLETYEPFENTLVKLITPIAKDSATSSQTAQMVVIGTFAMLIALPLAKLLNLILGETRWLQQAMAGDELERMLYAGAKRGVPVCLTMEDRKVYVGFVMGTPDPTKPRKTVSTLPLMSGYRDRVIRKVNFTTYYKEILPAHIADCRPSWLLSGAAFFGLLVAAHPDRRRVAYRSSNLAVVCRTNVRDPKWRAPKG